MQGIITMEDKIAVPLQLRETRTKYYSIVGRRLTDGLAPECESSPPKEFCPFYRPCVALGTHIVGTGSYLPSLCLVTGDEMTSSGRMGSE